MEPKLACFSHAQDSGAEAGLFFVGFRSLRWLRQDTGYRAALRFENACHVRPGLQTTAFAARLQPVQFLYVHFLRATSAGRSEIMINFFVLCWSDETSSVNQWLEGLITTVVQDSGSMVQLTFGPTWSSVCTHRGKKGTPRQSCWRLCNLCFSFFTKKTICFVLLLLLE
jgi:hypothetical protein